MPVQPYIATERLYLADDGTVVTHDDPRKRTLLVGVGGMLSFERARELGLTPDEKAKTEPTEEKAKAEPPANKAKIKAPENKAQ